MRVSKTCLEPALLVLFPKRCEICSRTDNEVRFVNANDLICSPCLQGETPTGQAQTFESTHRIGIRDICLRCGEPLFRGAWSADYRVTCAICNLHPLPVRYLRSVFWYAGGAETLIKRFKYGNRRRLSTVISNELCQYVNSGGMPESDWDLILALPSAPQSLVARGFNHTGMVARALASRLQCKTQAFALQTTRNKERQVKLSLTERHVNAAGSFQTSPKHVQHKKVLLIDDVVTSGASLVAAAGSLREAGAAAVDGLTLARSVDFAKRRLNFLSARLSHSNPDN